MRREFSAGFIIFKRTRTGVRYLLLRQGVAYWNFPKGHIEKNESDLKAAFREVREETGLKHVVPFLGFKRHETYFFRKNKGAATRFKLVTYFLAEAARNEQVVISHEHETFGWFSFADALKTLRYRGSKLLLRDASRFLKTGLNPQAQKIYQLTQKIPAGKVTTYGEIARALKKPRLSRFVGMVLNRNTDPAIPCHRVVRYNGDVGGFNRGAQKKIALLKREGIIVKNGRVDLAKFDFHF